MPLDDDFVRQLDSRQPTLAEEFWAFLRHNKKSWLLPIVVALMALGGPVALSGSGLTPFIYPF